MLGKSRFVEAAAHVRLNDEEPHKTELALAPGEDALAGYNDGSL